MERVYKMGMYVNGKVIYEIEVEADSVEEAREIAWENFEAVAYADEIEEGE